MTIARVKTDIEGFDAMLGGGFIPQTANLIEGAPGTGKTTLGMQFIYNGIVNYDEPGLIITFEEFPQQYYYDAASFGWDFRKLEDEGKLKIIMTSPEVTRNDLENVGGLIETQIARMGIKRIFVDSITHFERLTQNQTDLRLIEFGFINALKREGLTSLLAKESPALLGDSPEGDSEIAFVVDSYSILRYVEIDSAISKAVLVLKMRGSDHAKDIRQYEITPQAGFQLKSKFTGQEGILSGAPRRSKVDAFDEAFLR
ncbi:MAG: ATPase domain-containing protein [Chloroflexota bacterium]